jgi:phage terminase large subunit-like protein
MVLAGRAKKNWKSTDLALAGFYRFMCWESVQGNDCLIAANTEDQANDDLELARKLVLANPDTLKREIGLYQRELRRKDDRGVMRILPSRDAVGLHGKTALFLGFDEIHGYRDWDIFEALAPDPTRADTLTWITTYDTIFNSPGVPLYDLKRTALGGEDPRLLFQWYSADLCTDPDFAEKPPEERANPSMGSWPEGAGYLEQQRRRLPSHKFRRLHLNLPGSPSGAFFDGDAITACIMTGLKRIPPAQGQQYFGFTDLSGGSADEAVLAIGHFECGRRVLDTIVAQDGKPPFNPRLAVRKFARVLKDYGLDQVTGDRYAGETHRYSFTEEGVLRSEQLERDGHL